ncbi:type II toxin-antitoxin system VapC family toxin [Atribacter sp.]|uniref:type II toxin-antitoxin system VapC family toxin n=1 Tax=Atribacter sp. TaxID=2847780 RepID=UPI00345E8DB1
MEKFKHLLNNHRIIALDTSCFIYYFEEKRYLKALEYLFSGIENGSFQALNSVLTITEILVKPQSLGLQNVVDEYIALLGTYPNLKIIPLTLDIAVRAAEIRSTYKLRTPDAIHLATAWENQATLFLTNDLDFPPEIGDIRIIHLNQFS